MFLHFLEFCDRVYTTAAFVIHGLDHALAVRAILGYKHTLQLVRFHHFIQLGEFVTDHPHVVYLQFPSTDTSRFWI